MELSSRAPAPLALMKNLFFVVFFLLSLNVRVLSAVEKDGFDGDFWDDETSSQSLQRVEERMKSLSRSLNGMPEPPNFKQKINLPDEAFAETRQGKKS